MLNYRFWLGAAFVAYVFIDLIRRFFEGSKAFLVVFDLGLVLAYLTFFICHRPTLGRSTRSRLFLLAIAAFAVLIVAECVNPSPFAQYPITKVLALRNYLFGVPCVFLGYHLASSAERVSLFKWERLFRWLFAIVALFGVASFALRVGTPGEVDAVLRPMGTVARSYGQRELQLSSSFFATSVRFAFFLLGGYLFLWAAAQERRALVWPVTLVTAIGMYVSGSRTLFVLFLVFVALAFVFFRRGRRGLESERAVATVLLVALLAVGGLLFRGDLTRVSGGDDEYRARASYLVQDRQEYLQRSQMTLSPLFLRADNEDLLFGIGVGTYGQETFTVPYLVQAHPRIVHRFFYEEPGLPLADSGLTKICIEMGIAGLVVVGGLLLLILWYSALAILRGAVRRDAFSFALGYLPIAWLINFLKGHQVLGGLELSAYLYLCLGFVLMSLDRRDAPRPGGSAEPVTKGVASAPA